MTRSIRLVLVSAIVAAACSTAIGQTVCLRGTIEKADGNGLSLKSNDGAEVKLTFTESVMIIAIVQCSMTDSDEATYLGDAVMPHVVHCGGLPK